MEHNILWPFWPAHSPIPAENSSKQCPALGGICAQPSPCCPSHTELCMPSSSQPLGAAQQTLLVTRAHCGQHQGDTQLPTPFLPSSPSVVPSPTDLQLKAAQGRIWDTLPALLPPATVTGSELTGAPHSACELLGRAGTWPSPTQNHPPLLTSPNPARVSENRSQLANTMDSLE